MSTVHPPKLSRARRIAAAVVAIGLGPSVAAAPAHAATPNHASGIPSCVQREYSIAGHSITPRTLSVGISKSKTLSYKAITFTNCDITSVTGRAMAPSGTKAVKMAFTGSDLDYDYWSGPLRIALKSLTNSDAGTWTTTMTSVGTEGEVMNSGKVRVLRASRVSINATPEPVAKGETITVRGKLERASWNTLKYYGYGNRKVDLLFRPNGGTDQKIKTVTTAGDGSLRTTVTAAKDGVFTFTFAGSSNTGAGRSTGDSVDVR